MENENTQIRAVMETLQLNKTDILEHALLKCAAILQGAWRLK
jgi:hypothetical protein